MRQVSEGRNHFCCVSTVLLMQLSRLDSFPITREASAYRNRANPYKRHTINFNFCMAWQNSNRNSLLFTAHCCVFVLHFNVNWWPTAQCLNLIIQAEVFIAVKILFGLLGPVIVWCTAWALTHQRNVPPVQCNYLYSADTSSFEL
jgi:hypothetical protein